MALRNKHVRIFLPEGPVTYTHDQVAAITLSEHGAQIAVRDGKYIKRYFNVPIELVDEETLIETAQPPPMGRS